MIVPKRPIESARGTFRSAHSRAFEYLDGTLGANEESAFLDHLAGCKSCQAALIDHLQLCDRETFSGRRPDAEPRHLPIGTPATSRRRRAVILGALAIAAAAAVVAVSFDHTTVSILAQGPSRLIEIRLGYPGAAAYRKYDVPRGVSSLEAISPAVIAELDRKGDCRGVAAAYVLSGELIRAEDTYTRCPTSPELEADRAGLAVLRGQPEEALRLADRALVARPADPVALWNQALALRDLGLGLAAAESFDRVAVLDSSWGQEASHRATALRQELINLRDEWRRTMEAGIAMAAGGPPISADLAHRQPARARAFLHHAIRTARTRARLDELRPLAAAIDGLVGDNLVRYINQAAIDLTPARVALVDEYAAMLAAWAAPDEAKLHGWLARARAAGADDLFLGALDITGRIGEFSDEATRLATATRDSWFELAVLTGRAVSARNAKQIAEAATLFDEADRHCSTGAPTFRCVQLLIERAQLENDRYHPAAARLLSVRALHDATKIGEWQQRVQAVHQAGEAERFRGEFAAARAFYREYVLDDLDGGCLTRRSVASLFAMMSFEEHRISDARAAFVARPTCGSPPRPLTLVLELVLETDLLRANAPVRERSALLADLVAARSRADDNSRRVLDYLIARADLGHAVDATSRLRSIVIGARARPADSFAARAATAAASAALVDAGGRAAWSEVLEIAAEARGVRAPLRCAVVVASDDFQLVGAAVGPAGEITGVHVRDIVSPAEWLAPAVLRERVRGCELVDVLALPPWLGVGPLLEPTVPWRYVMGPHHVPQPGPFRRVIFADPRPPSSLGLPALAPWTAPLQQAELITGADATPERLAAAARDATILEIHAHTDRVPESDAPALALSPGRAGWAVTAEAAREMRLDRAPIVILADCVGGVPARYRHISWGLPAGFLDAGASAVIAALAPIQDSEATAFFAGIVADLERGVAVTVAVARARAAALALDPASGARHIVVFE